MFPSKPAVFLRWVLVPVLGGVASSVFGLANRVFVSQRSGNDANTCDNILAPCQTFAGAVTKLNPGGEAIVVDSGGYGSVTITKALTIEAPTGVTAFIHSSSGDAITINAGASDAVVLRGLVLNGGTLYGFSISNTNPATEVFYSNCIFSNNGAYGVHQTSGFTRSRGNNTISGNASGTTNGVIGTFGPL